MPGALRGGFRGLGELSPGPFPLPLLRPAAPRGRWSRPLEDVSVSRPRTRLIGIFEMNCGVSCGARKKYELCGVSSEVPREYIPSARCFQARISQAERCRKLLLNHYFPAT
ncbi:hypothetical protein AV530_018598 [Patagioenas fasciata monilis]|uniref:Uncharacterized protein n=1 Tax=Patagioenas fasciata monilis TaxID=372326 RepID=A0A1V4L1H9_PATFA|nr:hypothetical protein AV530_018598 [Patagioenas fasciata monilis]